MIILKTLSWSNCFSYGANNSIDLSEQKITQILGTNGVGKSSIPLILEEVLFNKNSKGVKKADIANRNINEGYKINLKFEKDSNQYEIDLVRKASLKVKLLKNDEDISSHTATNTYKTIEEIIAIDFKTFSQIVYQNTNASLNFLTATDANRKKFLIDLLGLEKYVNIFEMFKSVSRDVESDYAKIDGRISTIEKWLQNNRLTDTTPLELKNLPKISEEDQNEISLLMAEIKNISTSNRKISQNNQYRELLKSIDITSARNSTAEKKTYDSLQAEVGSLNARTNAARDEIKKLAKIGDCCPTCGQDVDPQFKRDHIAMHEKIEEESIEARVLIAEKIEMIKKENKEYEESQKQIKEWETLFSKIDQSLGTSLLNEEELQTKLKELQSKVREQQEEVSRIEKENQIASAHNAKIDVITEQTSEFEEQLAELLVAVTDLEKKKSNLEILKKAFSTNGLIAYKIENLVKELEELVNEYLGELSDGRFTLEFVVTNDKLNVEITDNGNSVDILALSSGELARVNTATLIAIRRLMSSISSSQINVLFLDEVITVLDDVGREKLVEVLLSEDELNTYLVSHGWSHPLLEKVEVIKNNDISEIV
jgi:DNA repair exonuclease SbcCD ATPase subunit